MQKSTLSRAINFVSLAGIGVGFTSITHAAGLEYDKQSVTPLFEPGNYAEVAYASVHPDIEANIGGAKVDNMMEDYSFQSATVKIAPTRDSAIALMYEQPWGVDTKYPSGNLLSNSLGSTSAKVETDSLTLLGGGRLHNNVWIFGGVSAQQAEGKVSLASGKLGQTNAQAVISEFASQLPPDAQLAAPLIAQRLVAPLSNSDLMYNLDIKKKTALVPVVGIGFEKPEIALKTSLTYRGSAEFDANTNENLTANISETAAIANPLLTQLGLGSVQLPNQLDLQSVNSGMKIKFPQSVNFDFQTGLSEKYRLLGMLNARWVNWKDFEVKPTLFGALQNGGSLVNYDEDQYSVEAALGKEFNPKLSAEVRVGYDSGTGQPLSPLGPYNSVKSLALGAQYKLTPALAISGGAQYSWLEGGDIVADGQKIGTAEDGNALSFGAKVGYHF